MNQKDRLNAVQIASGDLWAGAEVQLFTLAKALHRLENVSVRVVLLNHGELENRLVKASIPVDVLDESQLNGLQILWRLTKYLKSRQPDVVHTHRIKENILGGLAAIFAGKIPSLRSVHGAPEHQPGWRKPHKQILYIIDKLVGRFFQRKIIAVSKDLANQLCREFPAEKVEVIENGVDIDLLTPYMKLREKSERQAISTKIGFVGRLVPVKRVDIFIETAKYLKEHNPEISTQFHIYGDGPLRTSLEKITASLEVKSMVHFEGHCEDIYAEMVSLDIILITSDHEGLPMILLEAMALGIPVIAHAVGGIPETLAEGACGNLIMQQNPSAYANALIELMKNDAYRKELVLQAKTRLQEKYSANTNALSYLSQYQKFVSKTGGS